MSRSYAISKSFSFFMAFDNKNPINGVTDNSKGLVFILFLEDDLKGLSR